MAQTIRPEDPRRVQAVADYANLKKSASKIGKELGVTKNTVLNWARAARGESPFIRRASPAPVLVIDPESDRRALEAALGDKSSSSTEISPPGQVAKVDERPLPKHTPEQELLGQQLVAYTEVTMTGLTKFFFAMKKIPLSEKAESLINFTKQERESLSLVAPGAAIHLKWLLAGSPYVAVVAYVVPLLGIIGQRAALARQILAEMKYHEEQKELVRQGIHPTQTPGQSGNGENGNRK